MTTKTKRTKITIERHETTIVHRHSSRLHVWCEHCRSTVDGLTPATIADLYRVSQTAIDRMIDAAEIHFIKTSKGDLPLICATLPGQQQTYNGDKND